MKAAAVYTGAKKLGVVNDFPAPSLDSATSVKLRILQVGVCGTDREIATFDYGTAPEGCDYLVLGHEALGEVVEAGPEVQGMKPGDLAIPMVRRPCAHAECAPCRAGRQDFCITGDYRERGIMKMHGFMTEFVVDEARYMSPVPGALREVGVLVEPLTIAEKALLQNDRIEERLPFEKSRRAVVLGAGPVGLLGAMALRLRGYEVLVYSRDREPNPSADIVRAIGGRYVSSQDRTIEQMAQDCGAIDLVYEATGSSQLSFDVLKVLGPNGLFILTGVPGHHGPVEFDTDTIMRSMVLRNQCVLGTVNAGKDAFDRAVADLSAFHAQWPGAVRGLITGRYPVEQFATPILRPEGIKNIIELAR